MRYGLYRDEKFPRSKKRWKIAMENEINCLRFEMSTLKACLLDCTNNIKQLKQLSVENSAGMPFVKKGSEHNEFFRSDCKNLLSENQFTFELIEVENKFNVFPKVQPWPSTSSTDSGTKMCFGDNPGPNGTRGTSYRPTLDLDTAKNNFPIPTRVISITAMPEFTNWSPEELRLQDYAIAGPCQHRQFRHYGLMGQFCGTELVRFHPIWDSDPVTRMMTSHHCISAIPEYINKSFEELRLEDYILKSIGDHNQMKYKDTKLRSARTRIMNPPYKSKNESRTFPKTKAGNMYLWHRDSTKPLVESENKLKVVWPPLLERHQNPFEISNQATSKDTKPKSVGYTWTPLPEMHQNPFEITNQATSEDAEPIREAHNKNLAGQEEKLSLLWLVVKRIDNELSIMKSRQATVDEKLSQLVSTVEDIDAQPSIMGSRHNTVDGKLSELVSTVKNMDAQLSNMNSHQTTVDSNLSDIISRLSVMDSRLSGVNMFVTMQRFHKIWQFLEPRLITLETTPSTANMDLSTKTEQVDTSTDGESTFSEETLEVSSRPVNLLEANSVSNRNSFMDISDLTKNVSFSESSGVKEMSVIPNSPDMLAKLKSSDLLGTSMSDSLDSNSKSTVKDVGSKENKIEMANLGDNPSLITNLVDQSVRFDVLLANSQNIEEDLKSRSCPLISVDEGAKKHIPLNSSTHHKKDNAVVKDNNNPTDLTVNVANEENAQEMSKGRISSNEQTSSDEENDFVMVEKSEAAKVTCDQQEESLESSVAVESSLNENSDIKLFNDITEYLEVNLGKEKGSVYRFGFDAKQNLSGGDSLGNTFCRSKKDDSLGHTSSYGNKEYNLDGSQSSDKSSKDDSFLKFVSVFADDNSGKLNQSSPIVKENTNSKSFPKK